MNLNSDFARRVCQAADAIWMDSPTAGVKRRSLGHVGREVARATSLLR